MNDKVTLPSLAALLSEKTGKPQNLCEDFLREFFTTLVDTLGEGENVKIKGIGTFKIVEVEPRKSVNVNTGEEMEIPGHRKITFIPAKEMADDINSPFAMFESVEINDEAAEEPDDVEEPAEYEIEETAVDTETEEESKEVATPKAAVIPEKTPTESEEVVPNEVIQPVESEPEPEESDPAAAEELKDAEESEATEYIEESYEEPEKPKKHFHFLWGFLCGLFCTAIMVAAGYFLLADKFNALMGSFQDKEPIAAIKEVAAEPVPVATAEVKDSDSTAAEVTEPEPKEVAPTKPSDETVYDTITKTRYLTTMAKAHYGNYNLWPIIYEENKAMLGHPDRIRPGTKIVIPPLSKYGVDPNNPADVAKQKQKAGEIYARFK